jgi:iron complex outermembrane receptor protein
LILLQCWTGAALAQDPGLDAAIPEPEPAAATSDAAVPPPAAPEETEPIAAPADAGVPEPELIATDVDAAVPLESETPQGDGEMIVTAQRFEQDVQKTPVAVSAFTPRTMEQRGVTNLQDVGKFTPNLQLQSTNRPAGGGSAYAAYIRGIGTGDFQFPTDPGVGLYVDDVYLARTIGGLLSTDADIERIEVIKGPQGTLFGRNTIGGAINIVTSKPRLRGGPTGSALVRLGEYGRKDFSLSVNAPLVEEAVGAKLSVSSLHMDGYGERILDGQKTNSEERLVVRGGVLFKLSSDVNIRIDGDYSNQDQTPPAGLMLKFVPNPMTAMRIGRYNMFAAPALNPGLGLPMGSVFDGRWAVDPDGYKTNALQPMFDRYDIGGGSARLQWIASDAFSFKSISAARVMNSDIAVDGDQTPYPLQSTHTKLDDTQFSQEFHATGQVWDERLTYLVGAYAFRESGESTVDTQSYHGLFENAPMPMPSDAGDTLQRFKMTSLSLAAFTQETLRIIDGLNLSAGVRINRDNKNYDYGSDFPQRMMPQVPYTHAEASWTSITPKFGIDYSPIEPILVYASYSQGFKSGGFSASNNATNPTPKYDPERVTAYEVGFKTHWFEGRKLMTNVAAFYNDYRDIQLTVQSVDPVTNANVRSTQNSGASDIKGFEADFVATPITGLSFNAGAGYTDAKFKSLTMAARGSGFTDGERLPQIPDWTFNAGLQYAFNIGVGELTLRGDVSYKGEQKLTAADPTPIEEGYALLAARIAFVPDGLEGLEVSLYGLNLTDEHYYVYHATLAPTGQEAAIPGAPRIIFGSVKYLF